MIQDIIRYVYIHILRRMEMLRVGAKAALLGRHCVRGCYWDKAVWGQRLEAEGFT